MHPAIGARARVGPADRTARIDVAISQPPATTLIDDANPWALLVAHANFLPIVEPVDLSIGPTSRSAEDRQKAVAPRIKAYDLSSAAGGCSAVTGRNVDRHVDVLLSIRGLIGRCRQQNACHPPQRLPPQASRSMLAILGHNVRFGNDTCNETILHKSRLLQTPLDPTSPMG